MVFTKRTSPPRRPLHDRSNSETNELGVAPPPAPSIRLVRDSDVYATTPYPTQPLHVLSPKDGTFRVSGKDKAVSAASASPGPPPQWQLPRLPPAATRPPQQSRVPEVAPLRSGKLKSPSTFGEHGLSVNAARAAALERLRTPEVSPPHRADAGASRGQLRGGQHQQHQQHQHQHQHQHQPFAKHSPQRFNEGSSLGAPTAAAGSGGVAPPSDRPPRTVPLSPSAYWKDGPRAPSSGSSTFEDVAHHGLGSVADTRASQGPPARNLHDKALPTRPSLASLASSASSDALGGPSPSGRTRQRRPSASYSAFPPASPSFSRSSSIAPPSPARPSPKQQQQLQQQFQRRSATPPTPHSSSSISSRSGSPPSYIQASSAIRRGPRIQFPTIRAPSNQGSWAHLSITIPKRRPRMSKPRYSRSRQWSSDLSTVHSESDRASTMMSGERMSSFSTQTRSGPPPRLSQSASISIASPVIPEAPQQPRQAHTRPHPLGAHPSIRAVDDSEPDMAGAHQRRSSSQGPSARPARYRAARPQSLTSTSRRASLGDLKSPTSHRNSIVAAVPWAKAYYGSGGRLPLGGFASPGSDAARTRNSSPVRGRNGGDSGNNNGAGAGPGPSRLRERPHTLTIPPRGSDEAIHESFSRGNYRRPITDDWSPRLQPNRRTARYSVWEAPQLPDKAETSLISRRGMQVICFCLGFIFPLAWMLAAVLPLPRDPRKTPPSKGKSRGDANADIEKALDRDVGIIDEIEFEHARWWRNVNRIMSIAGLLILVAIIVMVVTAVRMQGRLRRGYS
ncbi:MAG: hypothetical protein M1832_005768 [Thelocarpon impressellum]|nr:MAG: hypothetical protein M1832_005768 [Thelocarpon impressellum]